MSLRLYCGLLVSFESKTIRISKENLIDNVDRWDVCLVKNLERDAPFR